MHDPPPSASAIGALVLLRPTAAWAALAARPRPRLALGAGLLLGLTWAGLLAGLAAEGREPSMQRMLPVSADRYYAAAAIYVAPLCVLLTIWTAAVAHGMGRVLGGSGRWPTSLSAVGLAYALPLWLLFVVPDTAAWLIAGFEALPRVMRFTGPLAVGCVLVRCVQAMRAVHALSAPRAIAAALVAAIAQGIPAALLIR